MKSYFTFLSRNKLYTFIEAVGLTVGLAFVILIGSYVYQQVAVTRENPDRESIYVLGLPTYYGLTYGLPDVLAERIPEIEEIARFSNDINVVVGIGGEKVVAKADAVDRSFFRIFPYFRFAEGSPEALASKTTVLVSSRFAARHNLEVGQSLQIQNTEMTVGGIVEDFENTLFPYVDLITSADNIVNEGAYGMPFDRYGSTVPFIKLRRGADAEAFYRKAEAICKEVYGSFYGQAFFEYLEMTRLDKIFLNSENHRGKQFNYGDSRNMKLLVVVGILLLLSSVFNYINLSFALTGKRAKEMATRRLVGASRGRIFAKYIAESVMFTAVCFGMAILVAISLEPTMNGLINPDVPIRVRFDLGYVAVFLLAIAAVGGLAGLLPAMLATRFKPIDIVKGTFRVSSRLIFSKVFIVFQHALAVFLIAFALVMEAQYRTSLSRPVHADIGNRYYLAVFSSRDESSLRDALAALPCVKRIGKARGVPGANPGGQYSTTVSGDEIMYRLFRFDSTAFAMLGIQKLKDFGTPLNNNVWFGQSAFHATGFNDTLHDISATLAQRASGCQLVAGVYTDFLINNDNRSSEEFQVISVQKPNDFWGGWLMEVEGDHAEAKRQIGAAYERWSKEQFGYYHEPIYNFFLTDNFREGLRPARNNMRLMELFMLLAVLISLLGLIAMSTYYAGEKAKSIAVRKVFGGTVETETRRSVREYMLIVVVACAIGVPLSVWAAQQYLEGFVYRLTGYGWIFAVSVLITLLMAVGSVLWQVVAAARVNPVETLQKE